MKFSIITPCFNSGKTLQRAIQSVLQQKGVEWEHIIVDGASEDETVAVLRSYSHLIWRSEPDKGQSDAMNKGFALSSGEIIIYLNADDELNAGWLQELATLFSANPATDMVVGNLMISRHGKMELHTPSINRSEIFDFFKWQFPLNPACYAYKRQLQEKVGLFPIDNHYTMDYWFLLRAYAIGKIVKTEYVGGTFYFDGDNKTSNGAVAYASLKRVLTQYLMKHLYEPPVLNHIVKKIKRKLTSQAKNKPAL